LTKQQHFRALTDKVAEAVDEANATPAGKRLIKGLQRKLKQALNPQIVQDEQRAERENQQRVLDNTPIHTISRITDVPAIMQSRNPMAKRMLKETPRLHHRVTQNNTPGGLPLITRRVRDTHNAAQGHCRSLRIRQAIASSATVATPPPTTFHPIPSGAWHKIVTQQAINVLTIQEQVAKNVAYTPKSMMQVGVKHGPMKFEHYANPMVHPVTGETIAS
jgi:hypothetical protein